MMQQLSEQSYCGAAAASYHPVHGATLSINMKCQVCHDAVMQVLAAMHGLCSLKPKNMLNRKLLLTR
jgi:hypothetical protein